MSIEKIMSDANMVEKVYEDALQPSFQKIGKMGEDLLKFVALPFTFLGLTAEQLEEKYKVFIAQVVNKIPEEKREPPKSAIASPLLDHIKYLFGDEDSERLIKMFSDLLANSINCDVKGRVHVSYVHTLLQLGAVEAEILQRMYDWDEDYYMLGVAFKRRTRRAVGNIEVLSDEAEPQHQTDENVLYYYSLRIVDDGISVSDDIFYSALSILQHHNLITSFTVNKFIEKDEYSLEKHDKNNIDMFDPYGAIVGYSLTQYGKDFMAACIEPKKNRHANFFCRKCNCTFSNVNEDGKCPVCGEDAELL